MKKETLKKLIKDVFQKSENIQDLEDEILKLIDLYEEDNTFIFTPTYGPIIDYYSSDEMPYNEICGCNPKNRGSGICGCVMTNQMIKKPK